MQQHISDKLLNRSTKVSHLLFVTRILFWIDDFPKATFTSSLYLLLLSAATESSGANENE